MPRVSVIIPTYNRAGMLVEAVESVLAQDFKDCEIIVVNDGSRDRTAEVMEKFAGRVRYLFKENGGAASARNYGLKAAAGELVAWLDDDDLFLPGKLSLQVEYFKEHPRVGLVYTGHLMQDTLGWQKRQSLCLPPLYQSCRSNREALIRQCFFANSTVMMKRECFEKAGMFNENLGHAIDYDMWLRTAAYYNFGCVPGILAVYRWHGRQISMGRDRKILPVLRERARELYEKHPCGEVA